MQELGQAWRSNSSNNDTPTLRLAMYNDDGKMFPLRGGMLTT